MVQLDRWFEVREGLPDAAGDRVLGVVAGWVRHRGPLG
jgi:hypothetical protein